MSTLNKKLSELGSVMKGFRDELVSAGLWDQVTVVISSEFGQSTSLNTSFGTDHGFDCDGRSG
jgi:uncharacterized protein (DUF1501 family)